MNKPSTRHLTTERTQEQTQFLESNTLRQREKSQGWRSGVLCCGISALVVFFVNISAIAWSISRRNSSEKDGRQILYQGSCETAKRLNIGIHLLINALSTVLLSSSNYCMQCLSAPSRKEVDKAHSKRKSLDIGIMSIRNLRHIAPKRVVLWSILVLSSIPLHLFYNSAVFLTIGKTLYSPIEVSSGFIISPLTDDFIFLDSQYIGEEAMSDVRDEAMRLKRLNSVGGLHRLDNLACINTYAKMFQTQGSLLLVVANSTPIVYGELEGIGIDWWVCDFDGVSCESSPRTNDLRVHPADWQPGTSNLTVSYCLSEPLQEKCKVHLTLYLMVVVTALSLIKAIVIISLPQRLKESPLVTVGDAVASFLSTPDPSTKDMCLVSKQDIKNSKDVWPKESKRFESNSLRLFSSASRIRWTLCAFLYLGALCGVAFGFYKSLTFLQKYDLGGLSNIRQLGIGRPSDVTGLRLPGTESTSPGALVATIIVTNLGQLIASLIYFSCNSLVTSIATALEWESYASQRKGLRISGTPDGEQRSTYFLQLPYRVALPLMILSGLLHWLVSQSVFLVSLETHAYDSQTDFWSTDIFGGIFYLGFSPLGMILIMTTMIFMILVLFITAMMRFRTATPVVASCSAAIAAACHTPPGEEGEDSCISKMQWGVTGYGIDGVGHCAFSIGPVTKPQHGMLYR